MDGCPHKILNSTKILLSKIFKCAQWPKQSPGSHAVPEACRRFSVYMNAMYTRTFGKCSWRNHIYGETVECMLEPDNFHDRNAVAVEKDGIYNHWLSATEGIARPWSSSDNRWNRSLHCDWKMVGKTARQAMDIMLLTSQGTIYTCNLQYHSTNYSLILIFVVVCNHEN